MIVQILTSNGDVFVQMAFNIGALFDIECQSEGINTVTLPGRLRAIFKNVTEV
jgi:hypothetical protein